MSSAGEWVFSDEQLRNTPSQRLGLSQVRAFDLSFRNCFHLMAPAPPFPYPLQENEDSLRRSGVALIADLVRLLEVYAMRRPPRALSPPSLSRCPDAHPRHAALPRQMLRQVPPS
jgi:hypothetical protein